MSRARVRDPRDDERTCDLPAERGWAGQALAGFGHGRHPKSGSNIKAIHSRHPQRGSLSTASGHLEIVGRDDMRERSSRIARLGVGFMLFLVISGYLESSLAADAAHQAPVTSRFITIRGAPFGNDARGATQGAISAAHLDDASAARDALTAANTSSSLLLAPLGVRIIVIGWAEFYYPGCFLNVGSWVVTTMPVHGTVSFDTVYNVDLCGLVFVYNTLFYTWTDASAVPGTLDTVSATWTSDDGKVVEPGTWTLALAPSDLVGAVLPSSRSVRVGTTATAFATVINAGPAPANAVSIAPATPIPATFSYQTTDPVTNLPTGTPNTPVTIPPGGSQSFVLAITPTSAFDPTEILFTFMGTNTAPAATTVGVNTLLMSGSVTPVADIVALVASGNPGIVDIPGPTGTGVFAVATVNIGAGATITASTDTGAVSLPVSIALCQTNPTTGDCQGSPAGTVTTQINAGETPTFGIFVTGHGTVPFDPANNRIFVRFSEHGIDRGSTSVAVQTQ
jgi:hypothetical protein